MLVIMAGLPGTGKSTLARAVASRVGGHVLDKDSIRTALFPRELIEYSREQDDFVLRVMLKVAGWILKREPKSIVLLDGRPFAKRYQIDMVISFADWIKTPWRIIECTCSEEMARRRIENTKEHPAANRDFELHQRVRGEWEEIRSPRLVVNTEQPLEECIANVVDYVKDLNQTRTAEL